ncbi:LysR family transcriptional regulator [Salinisphaera sp. LB1]|uniref:LysR family transcriptional regulator n=1 Tax=Salinisphaera sp. LB1 TaxID=2183911 RepID=UPI000D7D74DF|nr:LysR substrate-binding domain-containing protein [Salinisphaera sp. LB1]AWN16717.1 Transcriptional regulator, LysR family [Salinisphaera sp. LB1]
MHASINPPRTLDTDVLRSFVAIAEAGSFTAAARQVHRTPSALSMQIKGLENRLAQPLFVREARRVRVTEHGELLLSYARRLLQLNAEAVSHFLAPAIEGQVGLGLPDDLGRRVLPRALGQLAREHPQVTVNVVARGSAELSARVAAGDLDLALISAGSDDTDSGIEDIVATERMVWAGLPDGRAAHRRPLPLALANHGCAWRSSALAALDGANINYRIAYSSESGTGQSAAALADLAVAALPAGLVEPPLVALRELPALAATRIALIQRADAGTAAETLATCLRAAFDADQRN